MKFLKIFALFIYIISFSTLSFAITGSEAVEKFQKRMRSIRTMEGIISISHPSGEAYTGIFKYMSPGKFYIKFSNPAGKIIVSNNKKVWIFDSTKNVCGVQDLGTNYSGGIASIINGYFAMVNETNGSTIIKLKKSDRKYSEINILVDKSFLLKKVIFKTEKGGGFSAILSNVQIGKNFHNGQFEFDVPANAQTIKNPLDIR
jgi:outer membrane lipoprotein-sorting protein